MMAVWAQCCAILSIGAGQGGRVLTQSGQHPQPHTEELVADGAGELEPFLDRFDKEDPVYAGLHRATISLQRRMRACRQCQAYLQLTSGGYRLSLCN